MRRLCLFLLIISLVLTFSDVAKAIGTVDIVASQGKAIQYKNDSGAWVSEERLKTRSAGVWDDDPELNTLDANKSYLQFDISGYPSITDATLTIYAITDAKSYNVNGLNDGIDETWDYTTIDWFSAPGNLTTSGNGLIAEQTVSLYSVNPTVANGAASDDVTSFVTADTDGLVTFILTAGGTTYIYNVIEGGSYNPDYVPVLSLTYELGNNTSKAHNPVPADDEVADTSLASLSWTNPDPNDGSSPITCTVYFGTDPNKATMDWKTLAAGASSVAINTTNFPTYGNTPLTDETKYYWIVDCHDPSWPVEDPIPGEMWTIYVGQAPVVDAGPDQVVWLDPNEVTVILDGTVNDDGTPDLLWTQEDNGTPEVTIDPNNVENTTVTIAERGTYEFTLTADDGFTPPVSDTVKIIVGNDACDASHIDTGDDYDPGDANQDCIVNLVDFAELIAANWLDCTDTLTNCGG